MRKNSKFNVLEVLSLAQKIEDNGERFYTRAAEGCPKHRKFLLMMAEQERGHKSVFTKIKNRIEKSNREEYVEDLDSTTRSYLDAIADGLIFTAGEDPTEIFANSDRVDEVLEVALEREEDTILFFQGTRDLLKDPDDREVINRLIREEMRHVTWIQEHKRTFGKRHPLL